LLPYYVKGMVSRDTLQIRQPYYFPIDSIAKDYQENSLSFGTFNVLKKYIDLGESK
jgi:hypothetical protein